MPLAERLRVLATETLSRGFNLVQACTIEWHRSDGRWQRLRRETVDHGDGAAILLHDPRRDTVVLVRQMRYACVAAGYHELMIEVPAGLLDADSPEDCIRAEAEQETGFRVRQPRRVFCVFMSPGSLTERVHGFVAEYEAGDRIARGGGLEHEGEDIEVLELPLRQALAMVADGRICDAKTVLLLQHLMLPRDSAVGGS